MRRAIIGSLIGCALAGLAAAARAEVEVVRPLELMLFENIAITVAAKKEEAILKTTSVVSVIDAFMIEKYNFQTIAEAVQNVAGMDITRTTFMQGIPMARGIWQAHYANKILVLIDNVPSYSTVTGEGFINRVGIDDVERIEVLKGPASVLYGSNAYDGAINIVLKKAKADGTASRAHGSFGEKKYFSAGGSTQIKSGDWTLAAFANASDQEGFLTGFTDSKGVSGRFFDKRFPAGGNGSLQAAYGDHQFLYSGYQDRFSVMEGADPNFADGAGKTQARDGSLFHYSFARETELAAVSASATYDWNSRLYSRTLDDLTRTEVDGFRVAGSLGADFRLLPALGLELGYNYDYRGSRWSKSFSVPAYLIVDNMNLSDRSVHEQSYVAQAKFDLGQFNAVLGGRVTQNELFGMDYSPRLTLVYLLDAGSSLKLIAGRSFRAPSLFELYVRNTNRTLSGNTDLKPETAKSVELAYLLAGQKMFLQLQVYRALYEGFIVRQTLPSFTFPDETAPRNNVRYYMNGPTLNAWGSELELSYRDPGLWSGFFTATYVASDDAGTEANFKYIPDLIFNLGLTQELGAWFVSANGIYRGRTAGFAGRELAGNAEANLNCGLKLDGGRQVHMLSIKNAADVETLVPAVNAANLNAIPAGTRREILYTFKTEF